MKKGEGVSRLKLFLVAMASAFGLYMGASHLTLAYHGAEGFSASAAVSQEGVLTVSMNASAPAVRAAIAWYSVVGDPSVGILFDELLVGPGPLSFSGSADLSRFEPGTQIEWVVFYYDPFKDPFVESLLVDAASGVLLVPESQSGGPCGAYLPVITTLDGNPARMGLELMYGSYEDPQMAGHPWLESTAQGEALFGCLPPGEYWVQATFGFDGETRVGHTQRVVVGEDLRIYDTDGNPMAEPLRAEVRWMLH